MISLYFLPVLNFTLAMFSLVLALITCVLYFDFFVRNGKWFRHFIAHISWPIIMAVTIGSVILSLVYSEYFGFVPCSLCWLQRIAVYPQALLSVLAFRLRDETHFPVYGIGLSIFGVAVALYQYVYQMLPKDVVTSHTIMPCLADGSNADCAVKVIDVFGFITFPLISAVTFAFLIIVYLYMLRSQKHHSVSH